MFQNVVDLMRVVTSSVRSWDFRSDSWFGFFLVIFSGAVFVFLTFGVEFISGGSSYWMSESDDITQYIAGLNLYLTDDWRFPLLSFESLNYPVGTRATFVDSIPLLAFFLKILGLGDNGIINPYGYWVALSFILQCAMAWWLLRELECKSWLALFSLSLIFLMSPALMARLGHISLMSHWIILAAFSLYVRGYRGCVFPSLGWALLFFVAFYVNIYLFVMAFGIYAAASAQYILQNGLKVVIRLFIPFVPLVLSLFLFFFPLPPAAVTKEWGFGFYSMNLLSPFVGGTIVSVNADVMPGQGEGENYLGLGLIFAFFISLVLLSRNEKLDIKKHWPLAVVLAGCAIYSLSNQIYFSDRLVATISYPELLSTITSQFRASGRFFWPVGYAVAIFSIYVLYVSLNKQRFTLLLLALVAFQFFDLQLAYARLKEVSKRTYSKKMDYQLFDESLGKDVRDVYFFPEFRCGGDAHETLLPFMRYAAERKLYLNTGYIARYTPDCSNTRLDIANSNPDRSAYLFLESEFSSKDIEGLFSSFTPDYEVDCELVQWATVCKLRKGF